MGGLLTVAVSSTSTFIVQPQISIYIFQNASKKTTSTTSGKITVPAPTNSCQQKTTRITRSQTKKVDKLVKNIKTRTKTYGRPEKAQVSLKLADEDEHDSAKVGKKMRKVKNIAEGSSFAITKEERISNQCKFKERKFHLKEKSYG
ncbi:hypothetical protein K7X08_023014 [Anisodus acutangulus]|uniref:Uncharacterized protein n=1 Tax=Anisodus acutangulus TaxID=402998 RepID=A0A9Q1MBP2_9SOLA|nr:hypothetical protein K7X08_023014 [Anisodus acutangulus]